MRPKYITVLCDIEFIIINICALIWTLRMLPYHYMPFVQEFMMVAAAMTVLWLPPTAVILVILRLLRVYSRKKEAVLAALGGLLLSPFNFIGLAQAYNTFKDGRDYSKDIWFLGECWLYVLLSCAIYLIIMRYRRDN